jgi:DNA-binding CsgD family transcriptional regulator
MVGINILQNYINAINLLHDNDIVIVTDNNNKIYYLSQGFIKSLSLMSYSDLIDKQFCNIDKIRDNEKLLNIFIKLQEFGCADKRNFIISAPDFFNNMNMFNLYQRELVDVTNNNSIVGYASFISNIDIEQRVSFLYNMLGIVKEIKIDVSNAIELTDREREILFFVCLKLSGREISDIMSQKSKMVISPSTVGNIVRDKLFKKFNVYNIEQLITKAVKRGYLNIPENYFQYGVYLNNRKGE